MPLGFHVLAGIPGGRERMVKLAVVAGLAAVAGLLLAADIDESRLIGTWSGRIERPGLDLTAKPPTAGVFAE